MKKNYYSENHEIIEINGYTNADNERRKFLSLETNRRRRDMALRVKRQMEKEDERRKMALQERKDKQEAFNQKLRIRRKHGEGSVRETQSGRDDLDRILELVRRGGSARKGYETMWGDSAREIVYESPMVRYSGTGTTQNRARISEGNLRTFESHLEQLQQQKQFREQQEQEAGAFEREMMQTTSGTDNCMPTPEVSSSKIFESSRLASDETYRIGEKTKGPQQVREPVVLENIEDESVTMDDSLDEDTLVETEIPQTTKQTDQLQKNEQLEKDPLLEQQLLQQQQKLQKDYEKLQKQQKLQQQHMQVMQTMQEQQKKKELQYQRGNALEQQIKPPDSEPFNRDAISNGSASSIKSILKKQPRMESNPDLTNCLTDIRDSVDLARQHRLGHSGRSSSFSHGLDDRGSICSDDAESTTTTLSASGRKFVHFADHDGSNRPVNTAPNIVVAGGPFQSVPIRASAAPATLKPPLHPRSGGSTTTTAAATAAAPSSAGGSYYQIKKQSVAITPFQPPPRPRKISASVLEHEVSSMIRPTGRLQQPRSGAMSPERTPTEEAEIAELWREVRECLSRSNKSGSDMRGSDAVPHIGVPEHSGRGRGQANSAVSVASTATSTLTGTGRTSPFLVRHHGPTRTPLFPGQPMAVRDQVTVHSGALLSAQLQPTSQHQPMSVAYRREDVSESMNEFLSLESVCSSRPVTKQIPQRLGGGGSSGSGRLFMHRPQSSVLRPAVGGAAPPSPSSYAGQTQRSQLSIDEEQVKMSLDRLNQRLKNVTNLV